MRIIRRPSYDSSHLYAAIYNAMRRMEPHVAGANSTHRLPDKFVRKFKTAKELARRLATNSFNHTGYFLQTIHIGFEVLNEDNNYEGRLKFSSFDSHLVVTKKLTRGEPVSEIQRRESLELFSKIFQAHSDRWWD